MRTAARFSLERMAALDGAVRAGEYPNAAGLARRLEVSHRTIQRDVEFLRDRLGAPLTFDSRRNGYYYSDPTFRLPFLTLTEGELVSLFLAERALQQYRGTPYAPDLARVFRKIVAGLTDRITIDLGHLGESYSFHTTSSRPFDPGTFRDLANAIANRRRVVIRYWSASRDEEAIREVDPYHLASIDGQWYLVAYCHLRADVRMFVPARIRSLEVGESSFDLPEGFRIAEYLGRSFSVLRGGDGQVHGVRLRFTGEAVKYVQERTWHASQTAEPAPGGALLVTMQLSHLREVERWALSWGKDCEVLGPIELRERVAAGVAAASAYYTAPPSSSPAPLRADRPGGDGRRVPSRRR